MITTVVYEMGGMGDKVSGMVGDNVYKTGAKGIGFDISPWSDYGMPKPSCDDDPYSANSSVQAVQKCGLTDVAGRRWGQCDQWRSSCDKKFHQYFAKAELLVEAVTQAAGMKPGEEGHVSPCLFGEMYAAAQAQINLCVGSVDPVWGVGFPAQGEPGYVPRSMSYLFGGSPGKSNYPNYDEPYPEGGGAYHGSEMWDGISATYREKISNASFCRYVLLPTYPCKGADAYPGSCGGCLEDALIGCSNWLCTHKPLVYWDKAYNGLRVELIGAVTIYETTNAETLKGESIDEYCVGQVAEQIVAAPDVDISGLSPAELAYQLEVQQEKEELARKAEEQAMFDALLADEDLLTGGGLDMPAFGTVAVVAGLGVLAYFAYNRFKG